MTKYRSFYLESIWSVDDNGWYIEVIDNKGKTIHQTKVMSVESKAIGYAKTFCDMNTNTLSSHAGNN